MNEFKNGITSPKGFRAAGGACGIKKSGQSDLALIVADEPCSAGGVFTTNKVASAPVVVDKRHLRASGGVAQAIVCNSGNANAATGKQGEQDAEQMCRWVAECVGLTDGSFRGRGFRGVLPSSTGIIGHRLPMEKIRGGIETLGGQLARGPEANEAVARAITTTDLVSKGAYRALTLGGKRVQIAGICKGSGMIAPNLATMLVFLTTDATITPGILKQAMKEAVVTTFNRISVDQHTSPSDTVLILASGASGAKAIAKAGRDFEAFTAALTELCADLAYQIVQDGEGATKVFRVRVVGAKSVRDADRVGKCVVDSPLVKAAVHGGDPNWGRIVTAAGYSGATVRAEKMSLQIGAGLGNVSGTAGPTKISGGVCVYEEGQPVVLDAGQRKQLNDLMKGREIVFELDLGVGKVSSEWLGCDLSKQYVTINAEYTT